TLDALGGPLGADLGCRHAPDLLVVRLEEQLEEAPAEAVRDPILERLVALVAPRGRAQVRRDAARQLDRPELAHDVGTAQRIVEVAAVPEDARHARPEQELLAEDLVPQRVDLDRLRKEAMTAEVEAVPVDLDRLREPSDLPLRLEHDDVAPCLAEQVARSQAGRAVPEPQ